MISVILNVSEISQLAIHQQKLIQYSYRRHVYSQQYHKNKTNKKYNRTNIQIK